MLKLFRSSSPYSVIALFAIAIGLKLSFLIHPVQVAPFQDQTIWNFLMSLFGLGKGSFGLTFFAIVNIVLQALYLNKTTREFDLFPYDSYLPALSYVLITSLMPEWNYFSAFLVANWFILAILYNLLKLYAQSDVAKSIFNIGAFVSLSAILVFPNILFLLLIFAGLAILRPFKIKEWVMVVLGILTPVYFLVALLYLTDHILLLSEMIPISFKLPLIHWHPKVYITLITLILLLVSGFFYLNIFSSRMLIQAKKNWSLLLIGFLISLVIGFFSIWEDFYSWFPALLLFSLIFTNLWFEERKHWISKIIFYLLTGIIIFIQWVPIA